MQTPESQPDTSQNPENEDFVLPNAPKADQDVWREKSTIMAFGVLFILPILVILLCVVFFLPYIYNTLIVEPQSGAITQTAPGKLPPTYGER